MDTTIVTVLLSGLCSIAATLITSSRNNALQDERIKVLSNELGTLSDRVEQHNKFGLQIAKLETRVDILERSK